MKIVFLIARVLLGLEFVVFGLNGFLHFMPMQMPTGLAGQYMGALFASHELPVIFAFQFIGGLLVLSGQFVALGLVLLGPVLVNIVLFHVFMEPKGLPIALFTTLLWLLVFASVRLAFRGIFAQKA